MEFCKKLQELRIKKGLTQEELAKRIFVSRTAISKWESGRGYPSIESLRLLASFFSITIDQLLSSDEAITLAEDVQKKKEGYYKSLIFGLTDISALIMIFLPILRESANGIINTASLLNATSIQLYLKSLYIVMVGLISVMGILTLALQNLENSVWIKAKYTISLLLNTILVMLFMISMQPYASLLAFVLLTIKVLSILKK